MSDIASLLTAIAGLITALCGGIALVVTAFRTSRRERPRAARRLAEQLAEAAEDGVITTEELRKIAGPQHDDDPEKEKP